ncbi:MAG: SUF system NifU family Fe-S cluster assembly protein [Rhodospirillales bacterium]|nr:SUF system NifU family Fe-S cluster assembly protein [Rhodospirillales bacterium]
MSDSAAGLDDLRDLYQEVVMDRGRHPRHGARPARFDVSARGDNPMCGDRVEVFVAFDPQGAIETVGFEARGCAISIASADLMADTVTGRAPADARALFAAFREMVKTGHCPACDRAGDAAALERLQPLAGVHEYPSRVKCATLAWHALDAALDQAAEGKGVTR